MKKTMEILAPAGSFESLVAAVQCGANAVYLGGTELNARRNANNFTENELEQAVRYCHVRGVKVYQTINIVMFENEIEEAVQAIKTAADLGIDAVLTQDLGIAKLVKECAPDMRIHASTQMSIHNLSGVRIAEEMGFSRVVLARELSSTEIAHIAANTDLEVEVFVHGALCMSMSGQCYLSSVIGERSGNRGLCAQPCRLPFYAKGGEEYGLSLKDLTLVDRVSDLARIGVNSLKIEGRMKRPEYVAAAVTGLKNAIAGEAVDFETLRSVFSRSGFTSGYFDKEVDKNMFGTRVKEDVTSAQGVFKSLAHLYDGEKPRLTVDMRFTALANVPTTLTVTDYDGNSVTASGDAPQVAITAPTSPEKAMQNLGKTGSTPFALGEINCEIGEGLMIPASQLNALRREALEKLAQARDVLKPHKFEDLAMRAHPKYMNIKIPKLYSRIRSAQLTDYIAQHSERLIMPIGELPNVVARGIVPIEKLVAEIPRAVFADEKAMIETLKELAKLGIQRAWCGNLGAIHMAKKAGLIPMGGFGLNITNSHALQELAALGVADTELSFELGLAQAKGLGDYMPFGIIGYGYLPLMILRNCPIKAATGCGKCDGQNVLTDRKAVKFRVDCGKSAGTMGEYSELFNSVPMYLGDRVKELEGFDFYTLYFTNESREMCEQVAKGYTDGVALAGDRNEKTRGLYYRNVL